MVQASADKNSIVNETKTIALIAKRGTVQKGIAKGGRRVQVIQTLLPLAR